MTTPLGEYGLTTVARVSHRPSQDWVERGYYRGDEGEVFVMTRSETLRGIRFHECRLTPGGSRLDKPYEYWLGQCEDKPPEPHGIKYGPLTF